MTTMVVDDIGIGKWIGFSVLVSKSSIMLAETLGI